MISTYILKHGNLIFIVMFFFFQFDSRLEITIDDVGLIMSSWRDFPPLVL